MSNRYYPLKFMYVLSTSNRWVNRRISAFPIHWIFCTCYKCTVEHKIQWNKKLKTWKFSESENEGQAKIRRKRSRVKSRITLETHWSAGSPCLMNSRMEVKTEWKSNNPWMRRRVWSGVCWNCCRVDCEEINQNDF